MDDSNREWLTTGQAARLCSVTSDTVLKWIRRGRLPGVRTAGGHHRVARRDLEALMTPHVPVQGSPYRTEHSRPLRCWEYLSGRGSLREECASCTVYRVRAGHCFELTDQGEEFDRGRQLCRTSCQDCVYYRRVKNLATQILLITQDEGLVAALDKDPVEEVTIRVVRSGYEASALIHEFRPAFIIIDEATVPADTEALTDHLARDPRIPGMKLVVAVGPGRAKRRRREPLHERVVSVVEKPFHARHVAEIVASFPVESLEP